LSRFTAANPDFDSEDALLHPRCETSGLMHQNLMEAVRIKGERTIHKADAASAQQWLSASVKFKFQHNSSFTQQANLQPGSPQPESTPWTQLVHGQNSLFD